MNKILIHAPSLPSTGVFNNEARDSCFQPFIYLKEQLRSLGYSLEMSGGQSLQDCAWVWFFDAGSVGIKKGLVQYGRFIKRAIRKTQTRELYRECLAAGLEKRLVLFLWEPPSVSPDNWNSELHRVFPLIFTWHDNYVDGRKFIKIHYYQTHQFPSLPNVPFNDKKLLVNISGNKYSHHPRELYSARRAVIRYFEQNHPENFDLYGLGWNQPTNLLEQILPFTCQVYPSYRGTVINKWDVLPHYRFSLCYENIHDEPGYVTEKIFDSMRAGCVPIYWGASNISDYVDPYAFIDRRKFKFNEELETFLSGITEKEYLMYQNAIQEYLNSEKFQNFLPSAFAETIINALKLNNLQ